MLIKDLFNLDPPPHTHSRIVRQPPKVQLKLEPVGFCTHCHLVTFLLTMRPILKTSFMEMAICSDAFTGVVFSPPGFLSIGRLTQASQNHTILNKGGVVVMVMVGREGYYDWLVLKLFFKTCSNLYSCFLRNIQAPFTSAKIKYSDVSA